MDERPDHDVHVRATAHVGLAVLLAVIAAVGVAVMLVRFWDLPGLASHESTPASATLEPRLEIAPQQQLSAYLAEKQRILSTYQWLDESARVARVPLDIAMRAMVPPATQVRPER